MNKRSRYCVCAHARLWHRLWNKFFAPHGRVDYIRSLVVGCILIALFAWVYPYILRWYTGKPAISEMGQYGDVYGGLNTLFTGCAFVGLVITILQQRQEMRETREEFMAQTLQFRAQSEIMTKQTLDSAMFEYLQYMCKMRDDYAHKAIGIVLDNVLMLHSLLVHFTDPNFKGQMDLSRLNAEVDAVTLDKQSFSDAIDQLRIGLDDLSPWGKVITSWFKRVDQAQTVALGSASDKDAEAKQIELRANYKKNFLQLLSADELFVAYLQMSLHSRSCCDKEQAELKELLQHEPSVQNKFAQMLYDEDTKDILMLLLEEPPFLPQQPQLPEETVYKIISDYLNSRPE